MLTIYYKGRKDRDLEHRKITEIKTGVWVHVENPTADELRRLVDEAGLDEGLLSDATDPYEVPRVEKEGAATYVFTRIPTRTASGQVMTVPIVVIVAASFVVTIAQTEEHPMWTPFFNTTIPFFTTQKTQLFFLIFRQINRMYQKFLTEISKRVRSTSVNLETIGNGDIVRFVRYEQTLNDFLSALGPTNRLLQEILTGRFFRLYEDDDELIEDLSLSNGQLIETCTSNLKNIQNIRSAYSTIMSNNLNHVIKLLTVLTIVLTVPTMISSFFGMNVMVPFTGSPGAFVVIVALSLCISLLLLWYFNKKRWV